DPTPITPALSFFVMLPKTIDGVRRSNILECILLHACFSAKRFVDGFRTRRSGLEALVQPVVLLGHLQHAFFDERVHASSIGLVVARREVGPCRVETQDITSSSRQL